jgi:hypothetical protein
MSNHANVMPSRMLPNRPGETTWEDYEERLAREYPVRYFIASTVPDFFSNLWRKLIRKPVAVVFWLKCHLIPRHRYHLVDVRQPKDPVSGEPGYSHGWLDADWKIVYALMNILVDFIENEHKYVPTKEEAESDPSFKSQLDAYNEMMAIYRFWTVEQYEMNAKATELQDAWWSCRRNRSLDDEESRKLYDAMNEYDAMRDAKLNEMLHRLIDVRGSMWT